MTRNNYGYINATFTFFSLLSTNKYIQICVPGAILKTRINPNYERSDTRSIQLFFDVNDGYCKANRTYALTVNIVDLNEPPQYVPDNVQNIEVYEGPVSMSRRMCTIRVL